MGPLRHAGGVRGECPQGGVRWRGKLSRNEVGTETLAEPVWVWSWDGPSELCQTEATRLGRVLGVGCHGQECDLE